MPPALARLAHATGICPLPSRDWRTSREYAPCPCAIGARHGNMPPALARLAHVTGICPCRHAARNTDTTDSGRHEAFF
eukprot:5576752-Pyramimonas_sp.AAC.1